MMQKSRFTITNAKASDVQSIAKLERECFSNPWSENAVSDTMGRKESIFLIAKNSEDVVGYIGCYYVLDEGYITNIAVSENFRRQGIASALIKKLVKKAEEKKLSFVTLEVRSRNAPAISLYEGMGFEDVGLRPRFYRDPEDDARLMTYHIKK